MLPFTIDIRPGEPVQSQVTLAVQRAVVSGILRPGDRFPSVRKLSQELRINPNTAHKIVAGLVGDGLLEVRPGIGTVVIRPPDADATERAAVLDDELERVVVRARQLGITRDDVRAALDDHWKRLDPHDGDAPSPSAPKEES